MRRPHLNPHILNSAVALGLDRLTGRSTGHVGSTGGTSSTTAANGNREAFDVPAHSIVPASRSTSAVGEVRTSLGIAVVKPQHPVRSSFGEETTVGLAVGTAVADAVEVALPGGESLGECGVVALAL